MTLNTDVRKVLIGCVLRHKKSDDTNNPSRNWSRSLTDAKKQYYTTQRKCLAIVWAVFHLQPYLECHQFTICMDHDAIKLILDLADSMGPHSQWSLELSEIDFKVEHRASKTPRSKCVIETRLERQRYDSTKR